MSVLDCKLLLKVASCLLLLLACFRLLGREGNKKSLSRIKLNCSRGKLRDFSGILSVQF